MGDILGVIESIESLVLESKRVPLTQKVMVEEKRLLLLLDKVRSMVKNRHLARQSVELSHEEAQLKQEQETVADQEMARSTQEAKGVLETAKKEAEAIRAEMDGYADNVLSKLQLIVTKFQKNIIMMDKNIGEGRQLLQPRLETSQQGDKKHET